MDVEQQLAALQESATLSIHRRPKEGDVTGPLCGRHIVTRRRRVVACAHNGNRFVVHLRTSTMGKAVHLIDFVEEKDDGTIAVEHFTFLGTREHEAERRQAWEELRQMLAAGCRPAYTDPEGRE